MATSSTSPAAVAASTLQVVHYPESVLRKKALPIVEITPYVREVAARMIALMFEEEGVGLAAPQVGLSWRLFVAYVPPTDGRSTAPVDEEGNPLLPDASERPQVFINPVLSNHAGPLEKFNEGCLSLPEIRGHVQRPPDVTVKALDLEGRPFEMRATGLLSRCFQHEVDHLDGVLIIDKMMQIDRLKNRLKIRNLER